MEFLHPPPDDDHHVILLLVVSRNQKTRLVRFEWDSTLSLRHIEQRGNGQPVAQEDRLPLLLIPLIYGTAFILVCEHRITVYRDILTGNANPYPHQLEHYEPPHEPASSRRLPIWTQWARPMRDKQPREHGRATDNIYLCREDGVVRYIDIREDRQNMINSYHKAGILKANACSAFAALDLGFESSDLVVTGGEMGDGGLWTFGPRKDPQPIGTIRNWTPLMDFTVAFAEKVPQGAIIDDEQVSSQGTRRLFSCSGRGERHGCIAEVRLGVEATMMGPRFDLGEVADSSVIDMWPLPVCTGEGIYLLVSFPTDSAMVLLPSDDQVSPHVLDEFRGLDFSGKTVAAGSTAEGFLIQVTPTSVHASSQAEGIGDFALSIEPATFVAACLLTVPKITTLMASIVRKDGEFRLNLGHFGLKDSCIAFEDLGDSVPTVEPSCISVQWIGDLSYVFVGTLMSTLQVYKAGPRSRLSPLSEYRFGEGYSICDSIALMAVQCENQSVQENLTICGLRDGRIQTLDFRDSKSGELSR